MYTDVLLPTDGSRGALAAAGHGLDIARRYGATVHVLYVVDTRVSRSGPLVDALRDEGRAAVRRIEVAAATAGLTVVTSTAQGVPAREILAYSAAHGIDLVVMGTRGRTRADRAVLGSVAERVVRRSGVPVLTVRSG